MKLFSKFKEFKSLIENHIEKNIKTFRSDNVGEFTSNEFKDLCKESRIKGELSTQYNPQQNGVVERKNRTIMEVARAIVDCMGRPGFTIINQQHPKLTGPFGDRSRSDLKSHPK